jgi:hypothetical protein
VFIVGSKSALCTVYWCDVGVGVDVYHSESSLCGVAVYHSVSSLCGVAVYHSESSHVEWMCIILYHPTWSGCVSYCIVPCRVAV